MHKNPRLSGNERTVRALMPALTLVLGGSLLGGAQPVAAQTPPAAPKTCAPEGDLQLRSIH